MIPGNMAKITVENLRIFFRNFATFVLQILRKFGVTHQSGQRHSRHGADEFDGGTVVDVAVTHRELLRFTFIVVH